MGKRGDDMQAATAAAAVTVCKAVERGSTVHWMTERTVGTEVCCPPPPPGYVLLVRAYMCRSNFHVAASASKLLASACRCISLAALY